MLRSVLDVLFKTLGGSPNNVRLYWPLRPCEFTATNLSWLGSCLYVRKKLRLFQFLHLPHRKCIKAPSSADLPLNVEDMLFVILFTKNLPAKLAYYLYCQPLVLIASYKDLGSKVNVRVMVPLTIIVLPCKWIDSETLKCTFPFLVILIIWLSLICHLCNLEDRWMSHVSFSSCVTVWWTTLYTPT